MLKKQATSKYYLGREVQCIPYTYSFYRVLYTIYHAYTVGCHGMTNLVKASRPRRQGSSGIILVDPIL